MVAFIVLLRRGGSGWTCSLAAAVCFSGFRCDVYVFMRFNDLRFLRVVSNLCNLVLFSVF